MAVARKSKIYFFFNKKVSIRERTRLKLFLEGVFKKESTGLSSVNYIFCSDGELLEINRQYLKHDFYTDIVTFQLSPAGAPVEGEVYISIDRVRENAGSLGQVFYLELHRVIFHGALHLCGYRDKTRKDKVEMTKAENRCLVDYFKLSFGDVFT